MWIMTILAATCGLALAPSLIAMADSHRLGQPDRWFRPVCDTCGKPLTVTTLKCQVNNHRQRWVNPVLMALSPALLVAMVFAVPTLWMWPAYALFALAMILLTVTDLDTKLLPNRIIAPATIGGAILLVGGWLFDTEAGSVLEAGLGALGYFLVMYLLAVIARGGLGFGDVKLAFLIGMFAGFLGWEVTIVAAVAGILLGGIISVLLLVTKVRGRKDAIPFGPFMTLGGVVAVIWGQSIVDWYVG